MAVRVHKEKHCMTAVIHRPEAMNAINFEVMNRLESILQDIENDPDLRVFILTGSKKSFISGGDLREFHQITDAGGAKKMSERMISILARIRKLPCWTLAAINGHTYGGGWETILAFDIRVACQSAKFGFTQGKFYLPPGWGGISALNRAVGSPLATYWIASQKVIDTDTALRSGLIQDVFEDDLFDEQLAELKKRLTVNDRTFIEYIKSSETHRHKTDEIGPFSRFWESEEHRQRVNDFLNRKK